MESLINYESDDENKEHIHEIVSDLEAKNKVVKKPELDVNYELVEMDESDEDTNPKNDHDDIICASSTTVSPEDAPLVFRASYAPCDDIRCTSLDSRNSSDMEMDDNNSDSESEIQILEKCDGNMKRASEEKEIVENEPQPCKLESIAFVFAFNTTGTDNEEMDQSPDALTIPEQTAVPVCLKDIHHEPKNRLNYCKRQRSPEKEGSRVSPNRGRQSPERSWKNPRLEKKAAVHNKMGNVSGVERSGKVQLTAKDKSSITLPSYYNPAVMNPVKYAQQIQKRQLLWGNKNCETKPKESSQNPSNPWSATTFKNDSDGKMTEKFKRLMGIKVGQTAAPPICEQNEIIEKQEEMFSNMEAQYQVARMVTHTHRGVGLGYSSHPNRTSMQKNS